MKTLSWMLLLGIWLFISACRPETVSGFRVLVLDHADQIEPDMELPLDVLSMQVEAIPLETTDR